MVLYGLNQVWYPEIRVASLGSQEIGGYGICWQIWWESGFSLLTAGRRLRFKICMYIYRLCALGN